jgi:hypothetical protein
MRRRDFLLSAAAFSNDTEGRWLLGQQADDGGWHSRTYGLLRSGQSLTGFVMASLGSHDPRGLAFLAAHTNEDGAVGMANPLLPDYPNYATALAVRLTGVSKSVEYLLSRQFTEADGWRESDAAYGAWGMGGDRRRAPNAGHVDISMTRHVLSALVLAPDHPAMQRARIFLSRLQNDDGGFRFSTVVPDANKAGEASYGTATADGIISLIAAGGDCARVKAAKDWLMKHHRPDAAPGLTGKWPQGMRYYYAAASAQAFRLLGVPRDHDQDRLLRAERRGDGSWANPEPLVKEDDPLIATGFALSALR